MGLLVMGSAAACGSDREQAEAPAAAADTAPALPPPSPASAPVTDARGTYQGELTPASGPARTLTLMLGEAGQAEMATNLGNEQQPARQTGRWLTHSADTVQLWLTRPDGNAASDSIIFLLQNGVLTAIAYDTAAFGPGGLALRRQ